MNKISRNSCCWKIGVKPSKIVLYFLSHLLCFEDAHLRLCIRSEFSGSIRSNVGFCSGLERLAG